MKKTVNYCEIINIINLLSLKPTIVKYLILSNVENCFNDLLNVCKRIDPIQDLEYIISYSPFIMSAK
jgi:hypothetical protein